MELIEIQDLKKIYGEGEMETSALAGISLKIAKGELIAVIDSDSFPKEDAIKKLVGFFENKPIGKLVLELPSLY